MVNAGKDGFMSLANIFHIPHNSACIFLPTRVLLRELIGMVDVFLESWGWQWLSFV